MQLIQLINEALKKEFNEKEFNEKMEKILTSPLSAAQKRAAQYLVSSLVRANKALTNDKYNDEEYRKLSAEVHLIFIDTYWERLVSL